MQSSLRRYACALAVVSPMHQWELSVSTPSAHGHSKAKGEKFISHDACFHAQVRRGHSVSKTKKNMHHIDGIPRTSTRTSTQLLRPNTTSATGRASIGGHTFPALAAFGSGAFFPR